MAKRPNQREDGLVPNLCPIDSRNHELCAEWRGPDLSRSLQGAGGISGLLARTDMGQWIAGSAFATAFYHSDANGNVTCLMYPDGTLAAKYLYDPFGNMLAQSGSLASANRYRFSSKEWDSNSGLNYFGYRFYDPNLQRWPNHDPIGERGGINLYAYVGNNPVNRIDPLGLEGNPISSTLPGLSGAWNSDASGGGGLFYGPGYYQALAMQQAAAQAQAFADAIAAYNATVPSDFQLGPDGYTHNGLQDDPLGDMLLGGIGPALRGSAFRACPANAELKWADSARAAMGKGPLANPGAPLTPEMIEGLQQNATAAQKTLELAQQGLNTAGNPISPEQAQTVIQTMQNCLSTIQQILQSGVQAPKN